MSQSKKTIKVSKPQRSGKGTHGSITKAGKVRENTPRMPKTSNHRSPSPIRGNRIRLKKLEEKERKNKKRNHRRR